MPIKAKYITALASFLTMGIWAGAAQESAYDYANPYPAQQGRELPRTLTTSYPTQELAIEGSMGASLYLQPLTDQWSTNEDGSRSHQFKVPFAWDGRLVVARIPKLPYAYELHVNGSYVGMNAETSGPGEFDITKQSKEGVNTIIIRRASNQLPTISSLDAGASVQIAGTVSILSQPRLRIRDFVHNVVLSPGEASFELGVIMKTRTLNPRRTRVFYELLSPEGASAATGYKDVELEMQREDTLRFHTTIKDPKLWSQSEPNLYTLVLRTQYEGRIQEYVAYKIGLRTVAVTDGKLYINSQPIALRVVEYSDRGTDARGAIESLKRMGYNAVKVDRPQPEDFYRMCDSIGIYVCDQASIGSSSNKGSITKTANDPALSELYADRARSMYHRSQNHPSVIMFSLGQNAGNGFNLYEAYRDLKSIETSRPIVYLHADGQWNSDAVPSALQQTDPVAAAGRLILDADTTPVDDGTYVAPQQESTKKNKKVKKNRRAGRR